jgi:ribosomal protein S18 acetylase RimI-like enzyme
VEIAERVALGLVDMERKRRRHVIGGEVLEIDGLVLALSNLPDPALNSIVVERPPRDPARALREAEAAFAERDLTLGIDLQVGRHPPLDQAVREAGLARLFERPALAVATAALDRSSDPDGVDIEPVANARDVEALVAVGVDAFDDDPATGAAFYGAGATGIEGMEPFVAWEGKRPVGIATGYLHDGAVGVMGVGVVRSARRRGIGSALTLRAAHAFPEADVAWLHPSDEALSVYRRLGFEPVSRWEVWVRS